MAIDPQSAGDLITLVGVVAASITGGSLAGRATANRKIAASTEEPCTECIAANAGVVRIDRDVAVLREGIGGRVLRCESDIAALETNTATEVKRLEGILERNFRELNRKLDALVFHRRAADRAESEGDAE